MFYILHELSEGYFIELFYESNFFLNLKFNSLSELLNCWNADALPAAKLSTIFILLMLINEEN